MIDVTEDFYLFSAALRSLVPIMDRSGIQWRNDGQYDEFYDIADGLFRGLIISKFCDDEKCRSIFESYVYAMKKPNVARFMVLDAETGDRVGEFRRFISVTLPFDSIEIDSNRGLITREFSPGKIRISTE